MSNVEKSILGLIDKWNSLSWFHQVALVIAIILGLVIIYKIMKELIYEANNMEM